MPQDSRGLVNLCILLNVCRHLLKSFVAPSGRCSPRIYIAYNLAPVLRTAKTHSYGKEEPRQNTNRTSTQSSVRCTIENWSKELTPWCPPSRYAATFCVVRQVMHALEAGPGVHDIARQHMTSTTCPKVITTKDCSC